MQVNPRTGNAVKSVLQGEGSQRLDSALVGFKRGDVYVEGLPNLDGKHGAAQRLNSRWGGGVLLSQSIVREIKEVKEIIDHEIKEQKDKLDKIDKQNRENNQNVEHINRELDRISREMKEKASQKDSGK